MQSNLTISVAGSPLSTPGSGGTLKGLKRAYELGITGMELEWVQRVPGNAEHVEAIGIEARKLGITLTVHAPYYVNLNAAEPEKLEASIGRVVSALTMAQIAGALSVVVHPAFYLKNTPEEAYEHVQLAVETIMKQKKQFPDVNLALETMGKPSQFGTVDEVLRISKEFGIYPCIDPAHLHARSNGAVNSEKEWNDLFDEYEKVLGKKSLSHMHMHFSGIAYGEKGEKHHLALEESDAEWRTFLQVLKKRKIGGVLVCESPAMENDTMLMRDTFAQL